jgi:hypothetical protein
LLRDRAERLATALAEGCVAGRPTTKKATVAKSDAKESKPAKKLSQIEAVIIVLGKSNDAMHADARRAMERVTRFAALNGRLSQRRRCE